MEKGKTGTIRGDQKIATESYHNSLRLQKGKKKGGTEGKPLSVNMIDLDPREEYHQERIEPTEQLKEVGIGPEPHQVTKLSTSLNLDEELALRHLLKDNVDLFAWKPSDMLAIDPSVVCHHLAINPSVKSVVQRKRKLGEERRKAVDEEVKKLVYARFISEIKYPTWVANNVLVKKANEKWRMCVDYTD